ncbi:MAG TPA: nucleotidyltransferase family protein [Rhizomicrobium sp.]|jgi:molybdenum cofactor cytidylyltransferase
MQIAAIVLAAGLSTRMGWNKLVEEIGGQPMVRRVVGAALASRARPLIVVLGNEAEAVRGVLAGLDVQTVENPDYREGLGASIRTGISAVPDSCAGALIALGDMPWIDANLIDRTIASFAPEEGRAICVATHCGQRGHPVLFARRFFPELLALTGDAGAKRIVELHESLICEIEAGDDAPLIDVDTPEALTKFRNSAI